MYKTNEKKITDLTKDVWQIIIEEGKLSKKDVSYAGSTCKSLYRHLNIRSTLFHKATFITHLDLTSKPKARFLGKIDELDGDIVSAALSTKDHYALATQQGYIYIYDHYQKVLLQKIKAYEPKELNEINKLNHTINLFPLQNNLLLSYELCRTGSDGPKSFKIVNLDEMTVKYLGNKSPWKGLRTKQHPVFLSDNTFICLGMYEIDVIPALNYEDKFSLDLHEKSNRGGMVNFRSVTSSSKNKIVTGDTDGNLILWDIIERKKVKQIKLENFVDKYDDYHLIAIDNNCICIVTAKKGIAIWNMDANQYDILQAQSDNQGFYNFGLDKGWFKNILLLPNKNLVITSAKDSDMTIWDLSAKKILLNLPCTKQQKVMKLVVLPENRFATLWADKIKIWDQSGQCLATIQAIDTEKYIDILPDCSLVKKDADNKIFIERFPIVKPIVNNEVKALPSNAESVNEDKKYFIF